MSILIIGSSTCPLCERVIHARREAVQLPYAAPADAGELAALGRQYIHRACWNTWRNRSQYARAATTLLAANRSQLGPHADVLESDHLAWYELNGRRGFRLDDFEELVALEIPSGDVCRAADWLAARARTADSEDPLELPTERWTLVHQGDQLRFARGHHDHVIDDAVVSVERVCAWERLLRAMCRSLAPAAPAAPP